MNGARNPERGLTLTEVTVVMVLATLVMTGLVAFYLNSQATWMDGSAQAMTQREATLVLESIRHRAHGSAVVTVAQTPDADHCQLNLTPFGAPPESTYSYWWAADSSLHEGYRNVGEDRGAMTVSPVIRFRVGAVDAQMVFVRQLLLRTSQGELVSMGTSARLMNGKP